MQENSGSSMWEQWGVVFDGEWDCARESMQLDALQPDETLTDQSLPTPPRRVARPLRETAGGDFGAEETPERCSQPRQPSAEVVDKNSMWEMWGVVADGEWEMASQDLTLTAPEAPRGSAVIVALDAEGANDQHWSIDAEYDAIGGSMPPPGPGSRCDQAGSHRGASGDCFETQCREVEAQSRRLALSSLCRGTGSGNALKSLLAIAGGSWLLAVAAAELAWSLGPEPELFA
ncbi:unnamed protein product [Polarella glacialis]|uniref:Uncharacterized protein n=1 Tax=Polarella glacialis TaxID=89957 RepID=A0A813HAV2_POLGL|nr:unnamed protein product [Polarella glacialis]